MTNAPRISVITPCFNQRQFIEQTICSVLDQGYRNLEFIIIDGCSTDGSTQVIRRYEDQLAWWISQPDRGPADAINKGLSKATGDIVAFLSADDLYLPGALDTVANTMAGPDAPRWVVGQCERIDRDGHDLGVQPASAPETFKSFLMRDSGFLPAAATFLCRDVRERTGLLDTQLQFGYAYEYWCRLLAEGYAPTVIEDVLAARRERDLSSAYSTLHQGQEYIAAARKYADRLPLAERCQLWVNCDYRQRIYALAQAETRGDQARRFLCSQLLRRPWWLAHDAVRNALIHGVHVVNEAA